MTITKDDRVYTVLERAAGWTVSIQIGKVPVKYEISKADIPSFDELREYVLSSDVF